jgi:hypothetical protein
LIEIAYLTLYKWIKERYKKNNLLYFLNSIFEKMDYSKNLKYTKEKQKLCEFMKVKTKEGLNFGCKGELLDFFILITKFAFHVYYFFIFIYFNFIINIYFYFYFFFSTKVPELFVKKTIRLDKDNNMKEINNCLRVNEAHQSFIVSQHSMILIVTFEFMCQKNDWKR